MRNVLVSGGSRGLGLAISRSLALSGYNVVAIARSSGDDMALAQAAVTQAGAGALHFRAFDLNQTEQIPKLVEGVADAFGPLHGLVNNAALGTSGILSTMPNVAIERLVRLNVLSPLTLTKYAVRSMMLGHGGRIVNISSIVAATGYSGLSVYSATKASLIGFTHSLAREIGPLGITVNAVAPGFVDTAMTHDLTVVQREQIARRSALKRLADAKDIADAVLFLFSDKAKSITGTVMTVDAGNTA